MPNKQLSRLELVLLILSFIVITVGGLLYFTPEEEMPPKISKEDALGEIDRALDALWRGEQPQAKEFAVLQDQLNRAWVLGASPGELHVRIDRIGSLAREGKWYSDDVLEADLAGKLQEFLDAEKKRFEKK